MKKLLAICTCVVMLCVCASCKPSSSTGNSSNPSSQTGSLSNSASVTQTTSLIFAEDDNTKALFHFGMTQDQVKQVLADNQIPIVPNEDPHTYRITTKNGMDFLFSLGNDLLDMISINSTSTTQLYSPYVTQKGLKIGDPVETVVKLYGEPLNRMEYGDDINGLGLAYYYDIPVNLDDYYKIQTDNLKSDRGVYLRVNISQTKGDNFNKVVNIIYADKANN